MNDHVAERARERLGVELTDRDACEIIQAIRARRLPRIPADVQERSWFEARVQGVPAWVLFDYRSQSIVTVLATPPHSGPTTLFALADHYGVPHAEARRIAGVCYEHLRHAHKGDTLTHIQRMRVEPEIAKAAKKEETAMEEEKPEGYALSLIVQKTGMAEGTIKSLISRHSELQDLPYSTKAAGARVFFDPFVEWLAAHQGAEVAKVAEVSKPATSATRLSAALVREYRLAAKDKLLTPSDFRYLVGLGIERIQISGPAEEKAPLSIAEPAFQALHDLVSGQEMRS